MSGEARWMRRALEITERALHRTSPNPKVGCVIVKAGEIIAEGVTRPVGQAHAEVVALAAAGEAARGAEMYVTLEPCCHHGRTPPCTDAIIAAGVARVYAGVVDPNPLVAGQGLDKLRQAGVEAMMGPEGEACARAIAPFSRYILNKRPWVMLKAATTLDGRVATASGHSQWITGAEARADVHRLRAQVDAVLVGAETARLDNPRLTVRDAEGADPLRVVLDTHLTLKPDAVMMGPGALVLHGSGVDPERAQALRDTGARLIEVPRAEGRLDLHAALTALHGEGVVSLMVEGGGVLHGALLQAGLVDEVRFYIAPRLIGEGRPVARMPSAPTIPEGLRLSQTRWQTLGEDAVISGLIDRTEGEG